MHSRLPGDHYLAGKLHHLSTGKEFDVAVSVVLETLQCDLQLLQGEGFFAVRLEVVCSERKGSVYSTSTSPKLRSFYTSLEGAMKLKFGAFCIVQKLNGTILQTRIPSERASQEEQSDTNISFVAVYNLPPPHSLTNAEHGILEHAGHSDADVGHFVSRHQQQLGKTVGSKHLAGDTAIQEEGLTLLDIPGEGGGGGVHISMYNLYQ